MATDPGTAHELRVYASPEPADAEVQALLDALGRAVTSGDGKAAAAEWAVPAMLLGDHDVRCISSRDEIASVFSNAKEELRRAGHHGHPREVRNLTWITSDLALVEVRWPGSRRSGRSGERRLRPTCCEG
jgi:hypothetical protein